MGVYVRHLDCRWLVLSALILGATNAQSEAAVTQTPYQEHRTTACPAGRDCIIDFPAVPANFRIELSNVACYLRGDGDTNLDFLELIVGGPGQNAVMPLPTTFVGAGNDTNAYAQNDEVSAFAAATQHFQIYARTIVGQLTKVECNLSGQRVKLS